MKIGLASGYILIQAIVRGFKAEGSKTYVRRVFYNSSDRNFFTCSTDSRHLCKRNKWHIRKNESW